MDKVEFEQRLERAFDNNVPIAEKLMQLRYDLGDTSNIEALIDRFFDETLSQHLQETISFDDYYHLCQLHFKVANIADSDDVLSTPTIHTALWLDSVTWLTIFFEFNCFLSQDNEPFEKFTSLMILWWFKWVLDELDNNPKKSLELIQKYHRLFAYYYQTFELGERSIYKQRVCHGVNISDKKLVETSLYEWNEASDNDFDDCLACQCHETINAYCFLNKYDKALNWAEEILDGSLSCGEVPHNSNSKIAEAYFYTHQPDKALATLEKGYPLIKQKLEFIRPLAEFMQLYLAMGMTDKALEIYQENKHLVEKSESPYKKMLFYIQSAKLPIAEQTEIVEKAMELATKFDTRNGNDYYRSQLSNSDTK